MDQSIRKLITINMALDPSDDIYRKVKKRRTLLSIEICVDVSKEEIEEYARPPPKKNKTNSI